MKKTLLKLLLVIMSMALALFAISCSGETTSESEQESVSESVIESIPEEVPIVGAGENGEVNLGNALGLLAPVLDNDYITVTFTMDNSSTTNSVKFESQVQVNAYVKRTLSGYDVVANFTQMAEVQAQSIPITAIDIYYVDGLAVYGLTDYSQDTPAVVWYKFEAGTFNELINELNVMIANDPEALEIYNEAMKAVEKLEIILSEQSLASKNFSMSLDFSEYVNQAISFVLAHKTDDVYGFLLEYVYGVDTSDPEAVAAFESQFMAWCETNPTVANVIETLVASINATLIENARQEAEANGVPFDESAVFQINLEELCDLLQTQTGMTTAQIVELLVTEIPELGDYLTAPEGDESLFDYISVRAQMVTLNDIAKAVSGDPEATILALMAEWKPVLEHITVGEVINGVLNEQFNTRAPSGDAETGEVGEVERIDYVAMLEQSSLNLQALVVGVTFKSDAYGRPTEVGFVNRVQASYVDLTSDPNSIVTEEMEEDIKIRLSYDRIYVSFEIPQEILDVAIEAQA